MVEQQLTFADLVKAGDMTFGDGYRTKKSELGKPGLPILRVAEVHDGAIRPEFADYVSDAYRAAMGAKVSRWGDIVLTTKGTVGRVTIIPTGSPEFVYSPQVCFFRVTEGARLESKYLHYWFKSSEFWGQASSRKSQTDMADYLNLSDIRSLSITVPDRRQQHAIVDILGALDDKIAVNEHTAATVDSLVSSMYKLAVSDEHAKQVPLGDVAAVNERSVGPAPEGSLRYVDISSVSVGAYEWPERISWSNAPGRARRKASVGDTIWSTVRPNRRSHALILDDDPELTFSSGLAVLSPRSVGPALFYEATRTADFQGYLESVAEGSAYPAVHANRFKEAPITLPPHEKWEAFEKVAMILRLRAHQGVVESRTLARLRDTLLPQLMSGKLRVCDAEKIVEDAL
ncbi:restriction endonuclease subunit S [Saccharothrix algeriensis]|uniref:Type I restriction enzyme S subunit n=3 Tax=Saccharothrix algeriensis TaxID=173560 RepID=A0ABS2SDU4_9PSEU|nr:restriction endonuclease subunit S [Saccharothrix algeriensis]MBM7813794.1 type I restriction enzyme S subunit [Saccharothrix algeriensis]